MSQEDIEHDAAVDANPKLDEGSVQHMYRMIEYYKCQSEVHIKIRKPTKKIKFLATVRYLTNLLFSHGNPHLVAYVLYGFLHLIEYRSDIWFLKSLDTSVDMKTDDWLRQYGQE